MSAKDDLTIFLNVLSRVGSDGDAIAEFAKAKAMMNQFDSSNLLAQQQSAMQNQGNIATQPPQQGVGMPNEQIMPPANQNQGEMGVNPQTETPPLM